MILNIHVKHHYALTTEHYDKVAAEYDATHTFYHSSVIKVLCDHVPFDCKDVIADIGGGSGEIAHQIWKQAQLKNPVLCVDPAKNMVTVANAKEGVIGVHATAKEFFASISHKTSFHKILMCGSVSFFSDLKAVFTGVKECLSKEGLCVITGAVKISPLFSTLSRNFGDGYIKSWEKLFKLFDELGLKYEVLSASHVHPMPKSQWLVAMRKRFLTAMEKLTEEDIEQGIAELEKEYCNHDVIEVEMEFKIAILKSKD